MERSSFCKNSICVWRNSEDLGSEFEGASLNCTIKQFHAELKARIVLALQVRKFCLIFPNVTIDSALLSVGVARFLVIRGQFSLTFWAAFLSGVRLLILKIFSYHCCLHYKDFAFQRLKICLKLFGIASLILAGCLFLLWNLT